MPKIIMPGNRVLYSYKHFINRKSFVEMEKKGTVIRVVRDKNDLYRATEWFMVKVDGNKSLSKIHINNLENLTLHAHA